MWIWHQELQISSEGPARAAHGWSSEPVSLLSPLLTHSNDFYCNVLCYTNRSSSSGTFDNKWSYQPSQWRVLSFKYSLVYCSPSTFRTIIHPNLRSTVYCYGVKQGGVDEWDFIYNRHLTENLATEKVVLLESLGCTSEQWLLQRSVFMSLIAQAVLVGGRRSPVKEETLALEICNIFPKLWWQWEEMLGFVNGIHIKMQYKYL